MDFLQTPRDLIDARDAGKERLKPFREKAKETEMARAGRHYGGQDKKQPKRPINMQAQNAAAFVPILTGGGYAAEVEPRRAGLDGEAKILQLALDELTETIDWNQTREEGVERACLGPMQVFRYGTKSTRELKKVGDRFVPKGAPFVSAVSLDDYVIDGACSHRRNAMFEGHDERMHRVHAVKEFTKPAPEVPDVDPNAPPEMQAMMEQQRAQAEEEAALIAEFTMTPEEAEECIRNLPKMGERGEIKKRARGVTAAENKAAFDLGDYVELTRLAVYCDGYAVEVTIPRDKESCGEKFLSMDVYQGPDRGPYETLYLGGTMWDNPIPIPLASVFTDLGDAMDQMGNKAIKAYLNAKRVFTYTRGKARDAETVRKASDGEWIAVDDNKDIGDGKDIGGLPPDAFMVIEWLQSQANNLARNPQMASGSKADPNNKTATSASILQGNAAVGIKWMASRVAKLDQRTARHLGWFLTTDPFIEMPMIYRTPGGEMVDVVYSSEQRKGRYIDYNFNFRGRELDLADPNLRTARLTEAFTVLASLVPQFQAGILLPLPTIRILEREYAIEGFAEAVGDIEAVMFEARALGAIQPDMGQPAGMGGMGGGQPVTGQGQRASAYAPIQGKHAPARGQAAGKPKPGRGAPAMNGKAARPKAGARA